MNGQWALYDWAMIGQWLGNACPADQKLVTGVFTGISIRWFTPVIHWTQPPYFEILLLMRKLSCNTGFFLMSLSIVSFSIAPRSLWSTHETRTLFIFTFYDAHVVLGCGRRVRARVQPQSKATVPGSKSCQCFLLRQDHHLWVEERMCLGRKNSPKNH